MDHTDGLARWLSEQLDADAKVALDNLCIHCGNQTLPLEGALGVVGYTHKGGWEGRRCPNRLVGATRLHDPEQVLREVDSKRHILARCEEALHASNPMVVSFAKRTLLDLARAYTVRDGYAEAILGADTCTAATRPPACPVRP